MAADRALVNFGPVLVRRLPLTRCGPKLRDALGSCDHPPALKEPTRPSASSGHISGAG
jgi:hypothetical protein